MRFGSPQDAWRRGVATIFQELALAGKMTIADNIFLGREITRQVVGIPFLDRRAMQQRSTELLADLSPDGINPMTGLPDGIEMEKMMKGLVAQFGGGSHE